EVEKNRRLDDRGAAEKLEHRARDLIVIDAPLEIEPDALDRSVIALERKDDAAKNEEDFLKREADRFSTEVPLEAIDVPSRTLVLSRVTRPPAYFDRTSIDTKEIMRLDLVLALRGYATTIAIPARMPAELRHRIVEELSKEANTKGPAHALAA